MDGNRDLEALLSLRTWLDNGDLHLDVDVLEGLDNVVSALQRVFNGGNCGKQVVKLCDPPLPLNRSAVENTAMAIMAYYYDWMHWFRG